MIFRLLFFYTLISISKSADLCNCGDPVIVLSQNNVDYRLQYVNSVTSCPYFCEWLIISYDLSDRIQFVTGDAFTGTFFYDSFLRIYDGPSVFSPLLEEYTCTSSFDLCTFDANHPTSTRNTMLIQMVMGSNQMQTTNFAVTIRLLPKTPGGIFNVQEKKIQVRKKRKNLVNECKTNNPCVHGSCTDTDGSYTCKCLTGWKGRDCNMDINECTPKNPCVHGSCTNTDGSYTCKCLTGWQGKNCNTVNVCETSQKNACGPHASCIPRRSWYTCRCLTGWKGRDCKMDINECTPKNPCVHGSCTNTGGSYTCKCLTGWKGKNCNTYINDCTNTELCQNGGTCTNKQGSYLCTCSQGWNGIDCEIDIDECTTDTPCVHGSCTNTAGSYTCKCSLGWKGINCNEDINECKTNNPCVHGSCTNTDGSYTCKCLTGWKGKDCNMDINECTTNNPCVHGSCTNTAGSYTCKCSAGWKGKTCNMVTTRCQQPQNWGHCTIELGDLQSHTAAQRNCEAQGGNLMSFHSPDDVINAPVPSNQVNGMWIGLYSLNGVWKWTDNSPVDYTNFASDVNPTANLCVLMDTRTRYWLAEACNDPLSYVCLLHAYQQVRTSPSSMTQTTTSPAKFHRHLNDLSKNKVTTVNVNQILNELNKTVAAAGSAMDPLDLYYTAIILGNASEVSGLSNLDFDLFLDSLDTVLHLTDEKFDTSALNYDSSNIILNSLKSLPFNLASNQSDFINGRNLAFTAHTVDCSGMKAETQTGLADTELGFESVFNSKAFKNDVKASITLSHEDICQSGVSKVSFSIFRNQKLFNLVHGKKDDVDDLRRRLKRETSTSATTTEQNLCTVQKNKPASQHSASAAFTSKNKDVLASAKSVNLQFSVDWYAVGLHGTVAPGFWTYKEWNKQGCETVSYKKGSFHGKCNHLTDFTVLVDMRSQDPALCNLGLRTCGYIFSSLSTISLAFLTILLILSSLKPLKNRRFLRSFAMSSGGGGILGLPYLITLFLFFLFFTVFSDRTAISMAQTGCNTMAGILYFLLLSVICWTIMQGCEVLLKFYQLSKIGSWLKFSTKLPVTLTVCFGVPAILTLILRLSVSDFFKRNDSFCWVRPDYVGLAVILPIAMLVIGDILITVLLIKQMFYTGMGNANDLNRKIQSKSAKKRQLKQKLIVVFSMQIILGLPWVLQFFTIGTTQCIATHYLFTIFNSTQGVLLGLLYMFIRYQKYQGTKSRQEISSKISMTTSNYSNDSIYSVSTDSSELTNEKVLSDNPEGRNNPMAPPME